MHSSIPPAWLEHDKNLKPYLRKQRTVSLLGQAASLAFLAVLIFYGLADWLEAKASSFSDKPFLQWAYFFGAVALLMKVVGFPFSFAHYRLEKKWGLSKQSVASWLGDQAKGILVGIILGALVLYAFYFFGTSGHRFWWVGIWAFLVTFSVILAQLAPVLLLPLFIKMKPMEPGELKTRLLALSERFKVTVKEVFHLGLGEKTEKGNAAFMGLGKTKRIVIGDTLYEKFPIEEVEAVFAHELGHQVHNDLWKGLFLSAGLMLLTLGMAEAIVGRQAGAIYTPFYFFIFMVVWTLVQIPFNVGQAFYSRSREWAADRFASETTKMAEPLASALERLTYQNQGLFKPNGIWEWLTYSHPAPWRRIMKLRGKN